MKKLKINLSLAFCFFGLSYLIGQNSEHTVNLAGQSDGSKILLRWVVSDYETWQESISEGFRIERYTTKINGTSVAANQIAATLVTLENDLKPLSEPDWDLLFSNNNFAELAQNTLYDEDVTVQISGVPSFADAINAENSRHTRFLFSMFAADQDFAVAEGLAVGLSDQTAVPGEEYVYIVSLNSTNPSLLDIGSSVSISLADVPVLPKPSDLSAEGFDMAAVISWNTEELKNSYTTYDILRASNGAPSKINDLPVLFAAEGEENPKYSMYKDSLENNNTMYRYQVVGRTPFGLTGPPSDFVMVQGKPPRLDLQFKIDTSMHNGGNVLIDWNNFDSSFEPQLTGFNIYRSKESTKGFEKINPTLIPKKERAAPDSAPLKVAYYQLEAIDENDYSYLSPVILVQELDSIPPGIPTGLTGKFITSKRVKLEWDKNPEEDMKGYRLFAGNKENSNYTQITKVAVEEEFYYFDIEEKFVVDSIYFKILASDKNENYSEKSLCVAIARPDITPPSKPVLLKVNPTPNGIELGFKFSTSPDVNYHVVQRKRVAAPGWEPVLTIPLAEQSTYEVNLNPGGVTATCYIDSTILERRDYEFRMLAYDVVGNVSSSKLVQVRPYDNGVRGYIENFAVKVNCIPLDTLPNQGGYDLLDSLLLDYEITGTFDTTALMGLVAFNVITSAEYNVLNTQTPLEIYIFLTNRKMEIWGSEIKAVSLLSWEYEPEDQLKDFQIFRSAENSALMLYETLDIDTLEEYEFEDIDVKPGHRYFYQIVARHLDGGHSERSEMVTVKVPN